MHRYLVRFENLQGLTPESMIELRTDLRKECEQYGTVVKNLRVTNVAIEFDLFVPDKPSKQRTIEALTKRYGKLLSERDLEEDRARSSAPTQYHQSKEETMKTCVDLFNDQRYWECHETLEQVWRRQEKGDEKEVQQGFILAASALVHFQKNENEVCLGMVPRALAKLDKWSQDMYYSLHVKRLKESLRAMERTRVIATSKI